MLLLVLACAAPSGDTDPAAGADPLLGPFLTGDCDPLQPDVCGLPFPSNAWLVADASTVTGGRVALGPTTLPRSVSGVQSSPDRLNLADGFSPAAGPIAFLPGATDAGFAPPEDPAGSLAADSPTVILDATTGERIAHFAELDRSQDDDARRAILLRPVRLLTPGHRYLVALRGIQDAAGAPVAAPEPFLALRDDLASDEPSVEARRALYADIFDRLGAAGVDRVDLQLAWDFTVASRESTTTPLLSMRDDALGRGTATWTFDSVEVDPDPRIALRIEGTVDVPLFLDDGGPGGMLVTDDAGIPQADGTWPYPFVLLVPATCAGRTCPVVQYGHGLFGTRYDVDASGYYDAAESFGAVVISMDWIGMSRDDVGVLAAASASGDLSGFATVPDRSQQGFVNLAVALRALQESMAQDPRLAFDGVPVVSTATPFYVGGSQGGIYGATYMAITPDIERGALVVPGAAYSLMLPRSVYWTDYATPFIVEQFEDPREVQLVLGYLQMLWDHAEPSGYTSAITEDPFPGTPTHQVVLLEAIGDHQVPNLATELLARSLDATYLAPGNRDIHGLPATEGPIEGGNVLVDFDYGLPPVPEANVPMTAGDDPHGNVFFEPPAQDLIFLFLNTGRVENLCAGPCDPD